MSEPAAAGTAYLWSTWQDAQAEWLRAWTGWAAGAQPAGGVPAGEAPAGAAPDDPFAAWQRMARQAVESAVAGADPLVRDVSQRILDAQQMTLRVGGLMARAWAEPLAGAAADPAAAFAAWAEQLRAASTAAPERWAASADDVAAQWRAYLEALQRTAGPWVEGLVGAPGRVGRAAAGDRSELAEIMRLNWDAWERSVGRIVESPSLGFTRELDEKLADGFERFVSYRRAVGEYQLVLGQAWADAAEAVARALVERGEAGTPVSSLRELGTLWTEVADGVLEKAFRSEGYAEAQGRMVTAAMRYRMAERTLTETFLKMTDIPSRSELDEALREIYTLRRELRALRRELGGARGEAGGPPTGAARRAAEGGVPE